MNYGPTMKEVAEAARVSVATVSRILNRQHSGDTRVRDRVMEAARRLDYKHTRRRRRGPAEGEGRGEESMALSMHCSVPLGTYGGDILHGVEEEARRRGYSLYFSAVAAHMSVLSAGSVAAQRAAPVGRGIISVGAMPADSQREAEEAGIPVIQVNSAPTTRNTDCVMCDNFAASYKAVRWLAELGHRRIACIGCMPPDNLSTEERAMGYRQALIDAGIGFDPAFLVRVQGTASPQGFAAMERLAEVSPRPTAVFGVVDELAVGAIQAARGVGLRVPEDLSVVGVNDLEIARLCDPPLTTVRILRQEMGRAAVQALVERIRNPDRKPRRIDVLCEFVERASCAAPC
jgi:LacI family transcriptional regulator, galactose operon repressor